MWADAGPLKHAWSSSGHLEVGSGPLGQTNLIIPVLEADDSITVLLNEEFKENCWTYEKLQRKRKSHREVIKYEIT